MRIWNLRIATVDMVLWDDTRIVPHNSQLWAVYSAHGVATGTTEYVTMAEKFASDTCKCYTQQKRHCSLTKIPVMRAAEIINYLYPK